MPRSLRGRLVVLWLVSLASALAVGALLVALYRSSAAEQVARARAVLAHACDEIGERYRFYAAGWTPPADLRDPGLASGLAATTALALAHAAGVEGGLWQAGLGPLAYAYPTYEGSGSKTDLPAAERDRIAAINAEALAQERPAAATVRGTSQTLLLQACPLPGPIPSLTAWSMTRVFTGTGATYAQLMAGLGLLLLTVLGSAAWLTHLLLTWGRKLGGIETRLAAAAGGRLPPLEPTGERELDRIVAALNQAGQGLEAARARAEGLARQVAAAERLAALGRVAAGLAHEIRNPLAAMRLKAENGLAGDARRQAAALAAVLAQIARLEALLGDLLTLTQPHPPDTAPVALRPFLESVAGLHAELAAQQGVALAIDCEAATARLDAGQLRRALDNLVLNALQHARAGGTVRLAARRRGERLLLSVADDGPGVDAALRDSLFEPFVSGRPEGVGLGLSIVREIAAAHGGTVRLEPGGPGATVTIELPWQPSSSSTTIPASATA
jgi:signal transduction histidine kinase